MKKVWLILFALLSFASIIGAAGDRRYNLEKSFSQTAATVTFVDGSAVAFKAHRFQICNESTTDSLWVDISGATAVADAADPTTHVTVHRIPPANSSTAWACWETYDKAGTNTMSVIAASGKTPKGWIEVGD